MAFFREIWQSRELLLNLTLREVKGQYKRTVFGQLWSFVNPIAMMVIYSLVFGFLLRIVPPPGSPSGLDVFPLWLLVGLLPWTFFSSLISQGMGGLVQNAGLIQKVYFPRSLIPLSIAGSLAYTFLLEMIVLIVVLSFVGSSILVFLPLTVLFMFFLALMGLGLMMVLSILNVYFRDSQYIMGLLLTIWFYLTPIVYPLSLIEEQLSNSVDFFGFQVSALDIYMLNPATHFVEVFRNLLYDNRLPDLSDSLFATVASFLVFFIGVYVFKAKERELAEAL